MSLHERVIGISMIHPANVSKGMAALPLKRRALKTKVKDKEDDPPEPTAAQRAAGAPNVDTARDVPNITWAIRPSGR